MVFFYLLPSRYSIFILKSKFWRKIKFNFKEKKKKSLKNFFKYYSIKLSKKKYFSSCLSRSILFMIFLEICSMETNLYLGMTFNKSRTKVPHAWLELKKNREIITSKLNNCSLITKI